ncbi:MAG: flagellar export chaperone FlgN [Anaerovoracaceae bacterium]|jgi:Mg2+ and Co2+ transporter CorA
MTNQDIFNTTLDEFYAYLSDIMEIYRQAIPVLRDELEAIMADAILDLDTSLKSQQALILQTRNFQQRTEEYLSRLNIKADTLSEMANQLPEEEKFRFFDLLGEFEPIISEVDFYKDKCRSLLQGKLYSINKALENQSGDNRTYNSEAAGIQGSLMPKAFEKKI